MSSHPVQAKKHLGQHFLKDANIAARIVGALSLEGYEQVLEIGPGTGILTDLLLQKDQITFRALDVDRESVAFLKEKYPDDADKFLLEDFLRSDLPTLFAGRPFAVIGNFPYNISSQILFKVLDHKELIPELVGMLQKEVAERISHGPGSKIYGGISVLLQAYYEIEYLFTVHEHVFQPPPKVKSAVIRMRRKEEGLPDCNEALFKKVVKAGFNQRRKTLRNSLKILMNGKESSHPLFQKRPEQLSIEDFFQLTRIIEQL